MSWHYYIIGYIVICEIKYASFWDLWLLDVRILDWYAYLASTFKIFITTFCRKLNLDGLNLGVPYRLRQKHFLVLQFWVEIGYTKLY